MAGTAFGSMAWKALQCFGGHFSFTQIRRLGLIQWLSSPELVCCREIEIVPSGKQRFFELEGRLEPNVSPAVKSRRRGLKTFDNGSAFTRTCLRCVPGLTTPSFRNRRYCVSFLGVVPRGSRAKEVKLRRTISELRTVSKDPHVKGRITYMFRNR
jgi:hypothetical protein